jgi:hypothetical protein
MGMAYDAKISRSKAVTGSIDGAIAGVVITLVMGAIKISIKDMDANTENMIAGAVGVVVSALVVAAKRYIDNWMKHKDPAKPAEPPKPAAPVNPA